MVKHQRVLFAMVLVTPWPFKGVPSLVLAPFPCLFLVQFLLVTGFWDCYVKPVPEHKSPSLITQLLCSPSASCSSSFCLIKPLLLPPHVPVKMDHRALVHFPAVKTRHPISHFQCYIQWKHSCDYEMFRRPNADGWSTQILYLSESTNTQHTNTLLHVKILYSKS